MILVGESIALASSPCNNEQAAYRNQAKACTNCASGATQTSGPCSWSEAAILIFCDCGTARNCGDTSVTVNNVDIISHTSTCAASGTGCPSQQNPSTFQGNAKLKESSVC